MATSSTQKAVITTDSKNITYATITDEIDKNLQGGGVPDFAFDPVVYLTPFLKPPSLIVGVNNFRVSATSPNNIFAELVITAQSEKGFTCALKPGFSSPGETGNVYNARLVYAATGVIRSN